MRDRGYHCVKVEKWGLHPTPHRTDFLGIYDYLAFNDVGEIIAVQTTTKHNMGARRKKMLKKPSFAWWTQGGRRSLLHGWYKRGGRWVVAEEELTLVDWNREQERLRKIENTVNKNSPLYKELFPAGHE